MSKDRPFGWEVDISFIPGSGKEDTTFHFRGCTEKAARRKALMRIHADEVLDIRPVTEDAWIRCYGIGKM